MSETSVALITAGAALGASAITGALTWLAGRSNLVRQLMDQKAVRQEEHRREVYTTSLESLSKMLDLTTKYGVSRVKGGNEGAEDRRAELTSHIPIQLHQMSALTLTGPDALVLDFTRAHNALMDLAEFLDRLPPVGDPSRPNDPEQAVRPLLVKISDAVNAFGRAARTALEVN
ncbi:hypothetical protein ACFYZ8_00105 [Streptomyces sp. NPDC001668]|uniref:hypothetical protein n=1 Tax=unclassified Streptomyces TaxID=2593676 RepID=UPI0036A72DCF